MGQKLMLVAMVIASLMVLSVLNYRTEAASVKALQGSGQNGQLTCADGSPRSIDAWFIGLNKNKGQVFGGLTALSPFGGQLSININSGTVTENKFTASGVGINELCGSFENVSATVKGRCGSGDFQIILSNGARGVLQGTVACNN